ncbi:MAG: tRNA 2-selenouridine(34) synthase MnmH [Cyclobacteriaceae bacterium]
MQQIEIDKFLEESTPLLDIRSPAEYLNGHISGAISFPLFQDDERTEIGTIYNQLGQKKAIKRGLEIVGPRMAEFISAAEAFDSNEFRLHCWRGGMRSQSMGWLLEQYGFKVLLLTAGYKAFRNYQSSFYQQNINLKVITGYTGSKKTELLKALIAKGAQVIDLEGFANHPGSSFGNKLSLKQPTTEQFQNDVFHRFQKFDLSKPIWIEDESIRIGNVNLTETLYAKMEASDHIFIRVPKDERVAFLVESYGNIKRNQLKEATLGVAKKLGPQFTQTAIDFIDNDDLSSAAAILLKYYDERYQRSLNKKLNLIKEDIELDVENVSNTATKLMNNYGI